MRLLFGLLVVSALLLAPALSAQSPATAQGTGILEGYCFLPHPLARSIGPGHLTLVREGSVPDEWLVAWEYVGGPFPCSSGAGQCLAHGTLATGLDIDGCEGAGGRVGAVTGCVVDSSGLHAQGRATFSFGHFMPDSPVIGGAFDLVLLGDAIADAGCA